MTINQVYEFLQLLSNKNQSGGFSPDRFNLAVYRATSEFYEMEYKMWQATQRITDNLVPFLKTTSMSVPSTGKVNRPSDYRHISSCRHIFYSKDACGDYVGQECEVKEVNNGDLGSMMSSQLTPATNRFPKLSFYDTYIQFYPKNLKQVTFDYLRTQLTPYWDYDIVNNRPVFKARGAAITTNTDYNGNTVAVPRTSLTQELEFPDESHNAIVYIIARYLGVNLSKADLQQAANQFMNENITP